MSVTASGWFARLALAAVGFASGCAAPLGPVMVDGQPMARLQQQFVGQPYAIQHIDAHPRPGSPSGGLKGPGGRITGVVCGTDIEYTVEHNGDRIRLSGLIDNQHNVQLEIVETNGFRTISGSVAYREVSLQLFGDRLRGFVGRCPTDMVQEGDSLVRTVRAPSGDMHLRMNGLNALWQLPPADQAAVLPLVVECLTELTFQNLGNPSPPQVGFGGAGTAVPLNTIRLATARNQYCGGQAESPFSTAK